MQTRYMLTIVAFVIICNAGIAAGQDAQSQMPLMPGEYYGTLTLNGVSAPAGTVVTAIVNGTETGRIVTTTAGFYGWDGTGSAPSGMLTEKLIVSLSADEVAGGSPTIHFQINGVAAAQTAVFSNSAVNRLDLSIGAASQSPASSQTGTTSASPGSAAGASSVQTGANPAGANALAQSNPSGMQAGTQSGTAAGLQTQPQGTMNPPGSFPGSVNLGAGQTGTASPLETTPPVNVASSFNGQMPFYLAAVIVIVILMAGGVYLLKKKNP
jgi:hypothetical protein